MTRIIAGSVGGRTLQTPKGRDTRPTTDRVREAMFSRIEALLDLDGARVLDLFAGSGALGLEAVSRGAAHLLAVERHRPTARLVQRNAADLGLGDQVEVVCAAAEAVLSTVPAEPYDLALLDPPYPMGEAELSRILGALAEPRWLTGEALVVVERSARSPEPSWPDVPDGMGGLDHLDTRRYGETTVHWAEPSRPAASAGGEDTPLGGSEHV